VSSRYAVLLRGVNVGGVTVRSADLRAALEGAGFSRVRTVLASGNALVSVEDGDADPVDSGGSPVTSTGVRARAEAALLERYGREVRVVVRSQEGLAALVEACPYPVDSPTHHAYAVMPADSTEAVAMHRAMAAAAADGGAEEAIAAGDGVVYWRCPRGSSLATPVSKAVERLSRTTLTTTRNLRTLARLTSG
jgi:uncharacterized protein (DUF1697 family)